jgi:NADPH2:quinone reductase
MIFLHFENTLKPPSSAVGIVTWPACSQAATSRLLLPLNEWERGRPVRFAQGRLARMRNPLINAAVLHKLGEPPRFEQFPEPTPGKDEVIVYVRAAALKPVDKQIASGSHYASPRELPVVCGVDGVGCLDDGTRVFFGGPRRLYGAMAERTVVPRSGCWSVPENVDDVAAAALVNPGMSAWLALTWRAQLTPGESVLVLGATGVTGKLAVQTAKLLGAGRVVGAGRNEQALSMLRELGADATIRLDQPEQDLTEAFARAAGDTGFNVIIDYLWGRPTEALLAAITRADLRHSAARSRLVQVGESAGPTISLPAAVLRSSGLEIVGAGSGSVPPRDVMLDAYHQLMAAPPAASFESTPSGSRWPRSKLPGNAQTRPAADWSSSRDQPVTTRRRKCSDSSLKEMS